MQEEEVKKYLKNNPEFFEQNANLLAEIHLPSPHGNGTISLAERQQLAQRDKINALEERFAELVLNAQENAAIANKIQNFGPGELGKPLIPVHIGLDQPEAVNVLRRYRHLHTHFGDFGLRVLGPLAARAGRPWSVTVHAYDLFRKDAAVRLEEWAALDAGCTKVVAISRFHAEFVRARGVPAYRIAVIPNAASLAELFRTAPPAPTRLRKVLAVGRPVAKKGFPVLIQA